MSTQGYNRAERLLARLSQVNHADLLSVIGAISGGTAGQATEVTLASVLATLQGQVDFESAVVEDAINVFYERRATRDQDTGAVVVTYHDADGTVGSPTMPVTFVASNIASLATETTLNATKNAVLDQSNQFVVLEDKIEVDEDGTPTPATGRFKRVQFISLFRLDTPAVVFEINGDGSIYTVMGTPQPVSHPHGEVLEYSDGTDIYLLQHYTDGSSIAVLVGGSTIKYGIPAGFTRNAAIQLLQVSNTGSLNLLAGFKAVAFDFSELATYTATIDGTVYTSSSSGFSLNFAESGRVSPQISYLVSNASAVLGIKTIK
jgi:hypothetical protein